MSEEILLSEEEERQVEEGIAAQCLLDNPAFLLAIERVRQQCAEAILTSSPAQTAEREQAYNLSRGLSAVTVELQTIAALGETTLDNATRPPNGEDLAQDLEGPGFSSAY